MGRSKEFARETAVGEAAAPAFELEDPPPEWTDNVALENKRGHLSADERDEGTNSSVASASRRSESANGPTNSGNVRCLAVPSRQVSGDRLPHRNSMTEYRRSIPEEETDSVFAVDAGSPPGCVGDAGTMHMARSISLGSKDSKHSRTPRPAPLKPVENVFMKSIEDDELKVELAAIHRKLDALLQRSTDGTSPRSRKVLRRRSLVMGSRKTHTGGFGRQDSGQMEVVSPLLTPGLPLTSPGLPPSALQLPGALRRPSLQDVLTIRRASADTSTPKPPEAEAPAFLPATLPISLPAMPAAATASMNSATFWKRESNFGTSSNSLGVDRQGWDRKAIELKKQHDQEIHPTVAPQMVESDRASRMHLMLEAKRRKSCSAFLDKLWRFLEDPDSSTAAHMFDKLMPWFISFTVCVSLIQTAPAPVLSGILAALLDTFIDVVYLTEFALRALSCPSHRVLFLNPFTIVDIAASLPLFLRAAMGFVLPDDDTEIIVFGLMYVVPIVRLLKMLRRFEKLHLLWRAFLVALEVLPALIFILFTLALVFCVCIYKFENRDNMPTLPATFWFTIVTMTTVGYGDVTPLTGEAQLACGLLVVITMLYMSIPLGVLGSAFSRTWDDRDRILLMKKTRDRLRQWGYSASDIPVLFSLCDTNQDGELSIFEFRNLIKHMQIGFSDERIFQLFHSFDHDLSGSVDDREFVRALFPSAYHDIYQAVESNDPADCIEEGNDS